MAGFDDMAETLRALGRRQMYRRRRVVASRCGRELLVDGRTLLNFCSNDYLGLAGDPRVAEALRAGAGRWGVGSGASHLVCGHTTAHGELEEALAAFTGRPRALLFSSGYAANVGTITALLGKGDLVCQDRLNHASLIDGGRQSRAEFAWFSHADPVDLAARLVAAGPGTNRRLVVSDGTFSMDGDLCPLADLVRVAHANDAWLMIDDAHGFGVHGPNGCGVVDPARHGLADVPILVGTLGKAFGTAGAFVAGSDVLVETLIQRSRNYIYTTAMPAALAVATLRSLEICRAEPWRRLHLAALIARFRSGVSGLGLRLLPSTTPIQPIVIGEPGPTIRLSAALERRGFLVTAIRPPTVPAGTSRLRVTLTASHEIADVDRLVSALGEARAETGLESGAANG